ncbi:MAG: DUF3307 domain-containing protein [Bacteroidia bacterium]
MNNSILLISLFFCHFLADYTHLSTNWMISAKGLGRPLFPIIAHASVHALLMGITLTLFGIRGNILWQLIVFQLVTHFLIDVWKGRMNGWFPSLQSASNKWHWVIFGFDQFLHAIVITLMVQYAGSHCY